MEWTPERIKALRYQMELNQEEFGLRLGFTRRATVSELEGGKRPVSPRTQAGLDLLARLERFKPPAVEEESIGEPDMLKSRMTEPRDK